jgi:hypothetical protein
MRIYPLRTSSDIWKIKLYSKHICTKECRLAYFEEHISDHASITFIVDNPDYNQESQTCLYNQTLKESDINIDLFNQNLPLTIDGELLFQDYIVIPDKKIDIYLTFPLKEPKKIRVESKDRLGFSLSFIVYTIQQIYRWIYRREEETCTEKNHSILYQCKTCLLLDRKKTILTNRIENEKNIDNKQICAICLDEMNDDILNTICHHSFHNSCLEKWIEQKETCPTCRSSLTNCECKGKGYIYHQYKGKIIPKELRGMFISRNTTDGVFGIYGYDKEDLFLKSFLYNSVTKTLYPNVSA